jgi:hypothetical protein
MKMRIKVLEEAGYDSALYGFSLSYKDRAIDREDWWTADRKAQAMRTATANAGRGLGHDKWLRQVTIYLEVNAPRYWWSEFDTYKVGTVAQSTSTMHTLLKRKVTANDFQGGLSNAMLDEVNRELDYANDKPDIQHAKRYLPEGYLQRRVVSLNYAVLRCIIEQRQGHRLPEWAIFIKEVCKQVEHPELLPEGGG